MRLPSACLSSDARLPDAGMAVRLQVRELRELVGQGVVLGGIYGDYFRFSSQYFRKAYNPFINHMLPAMVKEGLVDKDTSIILPILHPKLDPEGATYHYLDTDGLFKRQLLHPEGNALYRATDAPYLQGHLNAPNSAEIRCGTFNLPQPFALFSLI